MLRVQSGTEVLNCVAVQCLLLCPWLVNSSALLPSLVLRRKRRARERQGIHNKRKGGVYDVR